MNSLLVKVAPYALVAMSLASWRACDVRRQREIGALNERLHVADSSLQVAERVGRQLAVEKTADSTTYRAELASWQAMRERVRVVASVETLPPLPGETVIRTVVRDSVRAPTLAEILAAADATIRACSDALGSCEAVTGNLRTQVSLVTTQRDAFRKLIPSSADRTRRDLTIAGVSVALCYFFCPRK